MVFKSRPGPHSPSEMIDSEGKQGGAPPLAALAEGPCPACLECFCSSDTTHPSHSQLHVFIDRSRRSPEGQEQARG